MYKKLLLSLITIITAQQFTNLQSLLIYEDLYSEIGVLSTDLLSKELKSINHCFSIITDTSHNSILNNQFFQSINGKPVFLIKMSDSEDLLSPNFGTVSSLTQIRNLGCELHLILISNGIQMERLLRFGEKYRILNTRAKFIIIFDYRLLSADMHYIWKRIVNVIFIKQVDKKNGNLFEINTVPFPSALGQVFVAKRLNFWRSGRYRNSVGSFFEDKTVDLNGELMKVVVLEHTPAVLKSKKSEKFLYKGVEVKIMEALALALNFTVLFYESLDSESEKWGRQQTNGTISGLLGEMVQENADFALGDLHNTLYHLDIIDLTIPYGTECLTFLTPAQIFDNSWKTLILPFRLVSAIF